MDSKQREKGDRKPHNYPNIYIFSYKFLNIKESFDNIFN